MNFVIEEGQVPSSFIFFAEDGHAYHANKLKLLANGEIVLYVRCVHRHHFCPGTAKVMTVQFEEVLVTCQLHTCLADDLHLQEHRMKREILRASRDAYSAPSTIFNSVRNRHPPFVAARVTFPQMRMSMRRAANHFYPNIPHSIHALGRLLSQPQYRRFTRTLDRTDNLFSGMVGGDGYRSVVFISERMRLFMTDVKVVFSDGTFQSKPRKPNCAQILQIVCLQRNNVVPLVIAIMASQTYQAYHAVLEHLQTRMPHFHPEVAITDFERPLMQAWFAVFNVVCHGCFWHFSKAVFDKAKNLRLRGAARQDADVSSIIRSTCALALLPPELLERGFLVLVNRAMRADVFDVLEPFLSYVFTTWITGWRSEVLSVYGMNDRTNNACESANRSLNREVSTKRPNIWRLLAAFQMYEQTAFNNVISINDGLNCGRQRTVSSLLNDTYIMRYTNWLLAGQLSISAFLRLASTRMMNVFHQHFYGNRRV